MRQFCNRQAGDTVIHHRLQLGTHVAGSLRVPGNAVGCLLNLNRRRVRRCKNGFAVAGETHQRVERHRALAENHKRRATWLKAQRNGNAAGGRFVSGQWRYLARLWIPQFRSQICHPEPALRLDTHRRRVRHEINLGAVCVAVNPVQFRVGREVGALCQFRQNIRERLPPDHAAFAERVFRHTLAVAIAPDFARDPGNCFIALRKIGQAW